MLIPATLLSQPDETIPSTIPADILADWKEQGGTAAAIKATLPAAYQEKCDGTFESACHWRRVVKMKPYMGSMKKVLYAKHFDLGGNAVGFLDGTRNERVNEWNTGSALYTLTMDRYYPQPEPLLKDATGIIKDPCGSPDGSYLVFTWWRQDIPGLMKNGKLQTSLQWRTSSGVVIVRFQSNGTVLQRLVSSTTR